MGVLSHLNPNRVFYYFEEISNIPRGSYNTKAVSDYCVAVAEGLGLTVRQDAWNNVVIHKPASKGCGQAPTLMLQGHLDMVCEKESGCTHNFETDGLKLRIDGDYVTADGTTLGGDDGIAVAMALAILEDDSLVHPPLEVVFTTEEEVGMDGAMNLDTTDLQAAYLLNLDSEDEGVLTVGCAGGSTMELHRKYQKLPQTGIPYIIHVHGLKGGHSGVEIQKKRCNSNKVMSTILTALSEKLDIYLASVNGGSKHNAIPVETKAVVLFRSEEDSRQAEQMISQYQSLFASAYQDSDADILIEIQPCGVEYKVKNGHLDVFSPADMQAVIRLLFELPNGVQQMSQQIDGLPETSLNLAIVRTDENEIYIELSNRSSNPAALKLLEQQIQATARIYGFHSVMQSEYPGWQYREDSRLRDAMKQIYQNMFGKEAVVEAIHAGLECGILLSRMPQLDIVSTGPDILDIHTPKERMSISSVGRTYQYVLEVLKYFTTNY